MCTHKLLPPTLIFPLLLTFLLCAVFHLHDANSPPMSGLCIRTEVIAVVLTVEGIAVVLIIIR